jgi:hypothetical protein
MDKIFFNSYNHAMEAAYDACLKINERDMARGYDTEDENLRICLRNEYQKWLATPVEQLDGKTPEEFMDTVGSLSELREMFVYGAVVCDDELPEVFLNKLRSFGEAAEKLLMEIACVKPDESGEESLLAMVMAIGVLGRWKIVGSVGTLIDILYSNSEASELIFEAVRDALTNIGAPSIDMIIDSLEQEHDCGAADEYLLMALSKVGRSNRSDKIYNCLKNAFLQMSQKTIAADSLAKYGDGRAVTAIRGFLRKNAAQLDRDTFYDLVSAVQHLGGNTDDITFRA